MSWNRNRSERSSRRTDCTYTTRWWSVKTEASCILHWHWYSCRRYCMREREKQNFEFLEFSKYSIIDNFWKDKKGHWIFNFLFYDSKTDCGFNEYSRYGSLLPPRDRIYGLNPIEGQININFGVKSLSRNRQYRI